MPEGTFNTPEYQAEIHAARRRIELSLDAQRNHNARAFILNTLAQDVTTADLERILAIAPHTLSNVLAEIRNGRTL